MVVIGLSAFSQSPSRIISLQPAYPLVVGESSVEGITIGGNALSLADTPLDSLPHYEIGQIFEQTVRCYTGEGHGFYVKADSLHSLNLVYSCEVSEGSEQPRGTIEFNETTGRFKYFPAADEFKSFRLTFTATNGVESISEDVVFSLMPRATSDITVFHSEGKMPDAGDYITIVVDTMAKPKYLNNLERPVRSISIAGKDIVFDDNVSNKVRGLSTCEDIYELNIYAERLIVRSALKFPQTNITVFAKELIFEDKNGVIASISTTPSYEGITANGQGVNGGNAGNITLNVKEMKGNLAQRFILNGADGQSTNRNGTPGNGGNGGTVRSTVDVSNYCDLARGGAGVRYDVDPGGTTQQGPPIGFGQIGKDGRFVLVDNPHAYLHPYYLSAVIRHANDAFINNCTDYTIQVCREYRKLIDELQNSSSENDVHQGSDNNITTEGSIDGNNPSAGIRMSGGEGETNTLSRKSGLDWTIGEDDGEDNDNYDYGYDVERGLELQKDLLEINSMLFRLEQGLDYFGNPEGWVPLLSFEVYLKNYDNEIDRAIPTLYMYYWLDRVDQTLQNMVRASQEAARQTENKLDSNTKLLNSLTREVPVLQKKAEAIAAMIAELTNRIEVLQNQLMAQAVKSVKKRNRLKNLFNIGKAIINAIPVIGTAGSAVSGVISTATSFASTLNSLNSVTAAATNPGFMSTITTQVNNIKTAVNQNSQAINTATKDMENAIDSVSKSIDDLQSALANNTAPNSEVQAEYNKLIANSAEWKSMMAEVDELNTQKIELLNRTNEVLDSMNITMLQLTSDALALDAFRRDVFTGNSKRDLNAMLYIEEMQQQAKNRLLLYDYYLRKAYEYRLLKPYEDKEFNLVGMFERFKAIAQAGDSVIDTNAYNTLATIFRERISDMTEKIVAEYSKGSQEQTASITIEIPKEQLDAINAGESVILNFHDMGVFSPEEENVRITGLNVVYLDKHVEGNIGYSGRMDIQLTHSGISQFRKNGNLYWFNHISHTLENHHTWGMRYDAKTQKITNIQPSAASASLLYSLLQSNTDKIMLFSRPSAWSDITVSKSVQTSGGADILIDSLMITLHYDFTYRPSNIRNIEVSANEDLMPYFACSEEDLNGRSSGNGPLCRSFRNSSQKVTFTATEKYETYYFKNWTDRAGRVVSDKSNLTVNKSNDQFYIANYERRVPILNVADTIHVGNDRGTYTVNVSNIGSGDTEMDWYVEDSIKTGNWIQLGSVVEGIDNGSFTFTCDANTTGKERVDSLEIFAPETDEMSKVIYIVQGNLLKGDVNKDGNVDVADIASIIDVMAGFGGQTQGSAPNAADVNGDGTVDVADIAEVISIMAARARMQAVAEE